MSGLRPLVLRTREATTPDLDPVQVIEGACFPHDAWSRPMLAEELHRPGARFLVLEADGDVAGFAIGLVVMDELNVLQVAVAPAERGRGYGRVLMEALHTSALHQDLAWLEVRADNTAAIALYEGLGYRPIATRPRYYADGAAAVVMRVALHRGVAVAPLSTPS